MLRVLLLVRDSPTRAAVRRAVAAHGGSIVAADAGTLGAALLLLDGGAYDLVFLGVRFAHGSGFRLVPHVRTGARIIFIAADERHAVRAINHNALGYLLTPLVPRRAAAALSRAVALIPLPPDGRRSTPATIAVRTGSGTTRLLAIASIALISAANNYTDVQLTHGPRHLVRRTLKAWLGALPAATFVQVHRRTVVNLLHLRRIDRLTDETSLLTVAGVAAPVRASFRYAPALRLRLAAHTAV